MDGAIVGAVAAILGSLVGGLSSLLTNWVTQNQKMRAERHDKIIAACEALYGEFIQQAARLLAHAAEHEDAPITELVPLFALTARIRLVASTEVINEAEQFIETVINLYTQPNLSLRQLASLAHDRIDPLRPFSEACRRELGGHFLPDARSYSR